MQVHGGATDVTTYFVLRTAADGVELTGATITNIDLQYTRSGATPAAKVDATALAATNSAHGDNQAIEIDATDQPGLYRVDWPDAAFAAGVREVILSVKYATAFTEHLRVQIDPPVNVEQWNATDVPSEHTAGYPIVTVKDGSGTGEINTTSGAIDAVTTVTTTTNLTNYPAAGATAAELAKVPKSDSNVTWNATAAAQIQSEANDALVAYDPPTHTEMTAELATADDATLAAIAALNNLSQANIRTAVGLGSANLDTQIGDLPTNAELATALGTADDAVLVQIALVKAKTDSLTFTVAGQVDANIQYVNDVAIVGDGSGTPFNV